MSRCKFDCIFHEGRLFGDCRIPESKDCYLHYPYPFLGNAKVLWGYHAGKKGEIIHKDGDVVRIVFPEFWQRPDGMEPEEANDNGWYFNGEWEYCGIE